MMEFTYEVDSPIEENGNILINLIITSEKQLIECWNDIEQEYEELIIEVNQSIICNIFSPILYLNNRFEINTYDKFKYLKVSQLAFGKYTLYGILPVEKNVDGSYKCFIEYFTKPPEPSLTFEQVHQELQEHYESVLADIWSR